MRWPVTGSVIASTMRLSDRFKQMIKTSAQDTRRRIAEAALEALRTEGFAGATSRVIARIGGFNQALIFYHYGSLENALLAGLDLTSAERMARYRAALQGATTLEELFGVARQIYREDSASGHVAVVSQLVAGSLARPELAQGVLERMEPWVDFCEEAIRKVVADSPLGELLPVRELAYGLVSYYLGANLVTHLGGAEPTEALFERLVALAPGVAALLRT
jgi:AcrR family transcriptional regulator